MVQIKFVLLVLNYKLMKLTVVPDSTSSILYLIMLSKRKMTDFASAAARQQVTQLKKTTLLTINHNPKSKTNKKTLLCLKYFECS